MSDHGLVLAWGTPVRGREQKAMEVFLEGQELVAKAEANGEIASSETVINQPSAGGIPGGHTVVWGTPEQIDAYERSEGFERIVARAGLIVDGLGVTRAIRGDALVQAMGRWGESIDDLA